MTEQESNNEAHNVLTEEAQRFSAVTKDITSLMEDITEKCVGASGMVVLNEFAGREVEEASAGTRQSDVITADNDSSGAGLEGDGAAYDDDPLLQFLRVQLGLARMSRAVIGDHDGYQLSDIRPGIVSIGRVEKKGEGYGVSEIVLKAEDTDLKVEKVDGLALDPLPLTDAEGQLAGTVNDRLTDLQTLYSELVDHPAEKIWTILKGDVHGT